MSIQYNLLLSIARTGKSQISEERYHWLQNKRGWERNGIHQSTCTFITKERETIFKIERIRGYEECKNG